MPEDKILVVVLLPGTGIYSLHKGQKVCSMKVLEIFKIIALWFLEQKWITSRFLNHIYKILKPILYAKF